MGRFASAPHPPSAGNSSAGSAFSSSVDSETFAGTKKVAPSFPSAPPTNDIGALPRSVQSPIGQLREPATGSGNGFVAKQPPPRPDPPHVFTTRDGRQDHVVPSEDPAIRRMLDERNRQEQARIKADEQARLARIQADGQRRRQALSYDWDRSRPTNDHEAARIQQKPVTDWTATEARKLMNHKSYLEASGPEFQQVADQVTKWFQHAFPNDTDPNGPIVTHRSATPMVHEEDRRAVDEAIARRKSAQAQPGARTLVDRPQWHYDEKTGEWTDLDALRNDKPIGVAPYESDPRKSGVPMAQQATDDKLTGDPRNDDLAGGSNSQGTSPRDATPAKIRELRDLMATDPEAYAKLPEKVRIYHETFEMHARGGYVGQGGYQAANADTPENRTSAEIAAREASGWNGTTDPSKDADTPERPRPRDGFTTEEPDVEWEGAESTYPEVGKMTYRVNGPIKAKVESNTFGWDGVEFNVDWKPLGPDGKVRQTWERADVKPLRRGGHAGTPAGYFIPPYENPHGWEARITIPPQPAYNGNSANPYVKVWVPKGAHKQYNK